MGRCASPTRTAGGKGATARRDSQFTVEFNNPLDPKSVNNSVVTAEPPIQGMTVAASYNTLTIYGATAGRTQYTVTISGDVQDIFGQKLGRGADRHLPDRQRVELYHGAAGAADDAGPDGQDAGVYRLLGQL